MLSFLQLVGVFSVVFGVTVAISYGIHVVKRPRINKVDLPENATVRMVGAGGVYRCHYLRAERRGLVFSSPIQRDHYVPLRAGESLMIQVPMPESLLTFRTTILERDADQHEFLLAHPEGIKRIDRRSEVRDTTIDGQEAILNGDSATMVDLSAGGAKVITSQVVDPGDQVRLELPANLGSAYGWALESTATHRGRQSARAVRIKFQVPLSGLRSQRTKRFDLR